jgi:hypothetical protein
MLGNASTGVRELIYCRLYSCGPCGFAQVAAYFCELYFKPEKALIFLYLCAQNPVFEPFGMVMGLIVVVVIVIHSF